jgi:hypothetical protein
MQFRLLHIVIHEIKINSPIDSPHHNQPIVLAMLDS